MSWHRTSALHLTIAWVGRRNRSRACGWRRRWGGSRSGREL